MDKVKEKAVHFLTALLDVYREEDNRELCAFSKLNVKNDDLTEDITAMLAAMHVVAQMTCDYDGDLIDFTHVLNKLAFQYLMDGMEKKECSEASEN